MATGKTTSRSRGAAGGSAPATVDHNEIKQWVEARGGTPACVPSTGGKGDVGILRIDFPGRGAKLQKISWDEWFKKFDERNLAFLHQDKTATGRVSRFSKLVSRDTVQAQSAPKTFRAGG